MDPGCSQNMGLDELVDRHQRMGSCPDLIGKGREAERHAFAGKPLGLAVEGLALSILLEQEHGEEAGPGPSAGHHMEDAGASAIFSQSRHENFSRTVWITFQERGMTSNVSVTSSPSFERRSPPQAGQEQGSALSASTSFGKEKMALSTKEMESCSTLCRKGKTPPSGDYPALFGRHVYCGLRQSIPSSSQASCEGGSDTVPSVAEGHTNRTFFSLSA